MQLPKGRAMSSKVAGTFRQIHTRIWDDPWFQDLLPEEKLLFIYLFSNERAALCGLYELSLKTMAFETGLRKDAITLALHRFGQAGKAFWDGRHVWVPNLRKYNETASEKVQIRIAKELAAIPDCELKRRYVAGDTTPLDVAASAEDGVSIPYPQLPSEKEKEKEYETESKAKTRRRQAPSTPRTPDPLFDAIAEVCQVDPATTGPSIGKVRAALLKATPPYSDADVRAFGLWWWDGGYRKRPPRVWDLQEQIGVVRSDKPKREPKGFAAVREMARDLEARNGK
jgi:hypothetical protein